MKIEEKERDIVRLNDILQAISGIEQILIENKDNFITQRAMERCFEILGEACRRVSEELKQEYPDIPWGNIIALRNVISHEYDKVEITTLWEIAQHKIPALKDWIKGILENIKK